MKKILVLGGSGFVGKHLVPLLQKQNHAVYILSRKMSRDEYTRTGSISNVDELNAALNDIDIVINLVGLSPLKQPKRVTYVQIHVEGVKNIVQAAKQNDIEQLIHISALGADTNSSFEYSRTKGVAEEIIKKSGVFHFVLQPSVMFGKGSEIEKLFNRFSRLPLMPLPALTAQVQPVSVTEIAKAIADATQKNKEGFYEIGGPEIMTMYELLKRHAKKQGIRTLPLPQIFAKVGMKIGEWLGILPRNIASYINKDNVINSEERVIGTLTFDLER